MLCADRSAQGEFVELPPVLVDGYHVHLADENAGPHVHPDEGVVEEPHARPADFLGLLLTVHRPHVAVGDEGVRELVSAVGLHFAGLEGVPRPAGTADRVVQHPVTFRVDGRVVGGDPGRRPTADRVGAFERVIVAL